MVQGARLVGLPCMYSCGRLTGGDAHLALRHVERRERRLSPRKTAFGGRVSLRVCFCAHGTYHFRLCWHGPVQFEDSMECTAGFTEGLD